MYLNMYLYIVSKKPLEILLHFGATIQQIFWEYEGSVKNCYK